MSVGCLPAGLSIVLVSGCCSSVSGLAWSFSGPGRFARVAAVARVARALPYPLRISVGPGVVVVSQPEWPVPAWLQPALLVGLPF